MMAMVWTAISAEDCKLIANADGNEVDISEESPEIDLMDAWSEVLCLLTDDIFQWNVDDKWADLSLLNESSLDDVSIGNIYTAYNFSFHSPAWVVKIANALKMFSDNDFINRCYSKYYKTEDIKQKNYRYGHDAEELLDFYHYLKRFYIEAANSGNGMLVRVI